MSSNDEAGDPRLDANTGMLCCLAFGLALLCSCSRPSKPSRVNTSMLSMRISGHAFWIIGV